MSTPNFYNQKNFKLYIQSFEEMSMEDFEAEFGSDSEIEYWEEMSHMEQMFYNDIIDNCDGFKTVMENFNNTLTFHEITLESGYYSGIQLYVEENYYIPYELDNEDCHYYYNMCRSKALRKYNAEVRKINKWMDKIATQYGWRELICCGIFSNGEAIYRYAEPIRKAVQGK